MGQDEMLRAGSGLPVTLILNKVDLVMNKRKLRSL